MLAGFSFACVREEGVESDCLGRNCRCDGKVLGGLKEYQLQVQRDSNSRLSEMWKCLIKRIESRQKQPIQCLKVRGSTGAGLTLSCSLIEPVLSDMGELVCL